MTSFGLGRYALGVVAGVAILTGCGGSQSSSGASGAMPQGASVRVAPMASQFETHIRPQVSGLEALYSFEGSPDGADPWSGLVVLTKRQCGAPCPRGGLIGTTLMGGDSNNDGTVYGVMSGKKGSWTESVLYTFKGYPSDGSEPTGILAETQPNRVFVTTVAGGTNSLGTVADLSCSSDWGQCESQSGAVYSFAGTPDGAKPYGAVIADKAGNLYGTTSAGGTDNAGTVYRMQPKGSSYIESVLYSFESGKDGDQPYAGLIIDKKGALYGTTVEGGATGYGSVFKLMPSGSGYAKSILYSFQGVPDGSQPYSGVCADPHGALYGTTEEGGTQNLGTVYKLAPSGSSYKEKVLWNFGSGSGDGTSPYGGVLVDKDGVIAGTTYGGGSGGSSGLGTFFTLTPSGGTYKESIYSFTGTDGANPYAGPSVDENGRVYGTTTQSGGEDLNWGSIWGYTKLILRSVPPACW